MKNDININLGMLSVITVNYDQPRLLLENYNKNKKAAFRDIPCEFIMVNNGSNKLEAGGEENLRVINNRRNAGFAAGCNQGLKQAQGNKVLFLNPDVALLDSGLEKMIEFLDKHPEVGIISCKMLNPDGTLQYSCRRFPRLRDIAWRYARMDKIFPNSSSACRYLMKDKSHDSIMEADWVTGAFMLAKKPVMEEIGGFDERYFLYYEDADLCLRLKKKGYKIIYYPDYTAIHEYQRASAKGIFNKLTLIHAKSVAYFFWKHRINRH